MFFFFLALSLYLSISVPLSLYHSPPFSTNILLARREGRVLAAEGQGQAGAGRGAHLHLVQGRTGVRSRRQIQGTKRQ